MDQRQRVRMTLQHRQPDRVPYHIAFTREARRRTAKYLGDPDFEDKLDNALAMLSIRRLVGYRQVAPEIWEDEFGVRYDQRVDKDIGTICNRLVHPGNVDTYPLPDPDDPQRFEGVRALIDRSRNRFVVINHGFSLFERAWSLAGMEQLLVGMLADRGFVETLLDRILEYNLRLINNYCRFDIDAMMFGDDWGHQQGLIMGPRLWRELIRPRVERMYRAVRDTVA